MSQLQSIATAHRGMIALYAHNLKTGETASIKPMSRCKTASVIKMGILLDAAEQIRAGKASFDENFGADQGEPGAGFGRAGSVELRR